MQTDVIRQGQSTKGLIEACNDVIARYAENVVYIVNKLPWESASKVREFVARLSVVSKLLFDKKRGDAFSHPALLQALRSMGPIRSRSLAPTGIIASRRRRSVP
ncbi:hypothetical protein [Olsenella profusa]|uniref:hypothetical protein n=1 Tax=Olsenella profusa TaxID=138595 RepID=UPI001E3E4EE7|nr:hypothetical protein [Olsenella profusa]